jgi:hypothetical protein
MLPDPTAEPDSIPNAPTLASLLAWSRLGTAQAMLALGRADEAQKQYTAVRAYLSNWPATATNRETMYEVDSRARLGQAQAAFAAKDYDSAFRQLMTGEGWPGRLPADLEKDRKELSEKVSAALIQSQNDEAAARRRMTPRQLQIEAREQPIQQLRENRDSILAEMKSPDTSDQDKEVLRKSVAELNHMIEQRKAALEKYKATPEEAPPPRRGPAS